MAVAGAVETEYTDAMSLLEDVKSLVKSTGIHHAVWRRSPHNRLLLNHYLREEKVRRLQIGGGLNVLPGWLNTDLALMSARVMHLDATKPFPLPSDCFDYVYSEHMIEHIPLRGAGNMLRESFRVLKPGGRIRVATPDLEFLLALRREPHAEPHQSYIRWSAATGDLDAAAPMAVFNNFVRAWGHVFIYDEVTLRGLLESTGFVDLRRCKIRESDDPNLANLEFVDRMPAGFLELESMILEARKPG